MARKPVFQRTVKVTNVTVLAVNTETKETKDYIVHIRKAPKSDEAIMKLLRAEYFAEPEKPVAILNKGVTSELYMIDEDTFFKYAKLVTDDGGKDENEEVNENEQ